MSRVGSIIFMMFAASTASASELTPEEFVTLRTQELVEEVRHLNYVLGVLKQKDDSKSVFYNEEFEKNQQLYNTLLQEAGVTLKEYHDYKRENEAEILVWLETHPKENQDLVKLEEEKKKVIDQNNKKLEFRTINKEEGK